MTIHALVNTHSGNDTSMLNNTSARLLPSVVLRAVGGSGYSGLWPGPGDQGRLCWWLAFELRSKGCVVPNQVKVWVIWEVEKSGS